MLDSFKMAGALAGLMKNKDALKTAGERIKARLAALRASGSAGGGAVQVTVSGHMKVLDVVLSPALTSGLGDTAARAAAQSLIAEATNDAIAQAQQMAQREIAREAEALGLPDIPGLDKLLGG